MSAVIRYAVQVRLIARTGTSRPHRATLHYDAEDPFAVRVVFPPEMSLDADEVEWIFSRELLQEGLRAPAGDGDVHLWPCGPAHTMLELRAEEGVALVELDGGAVQRFLRATYGCVPRGGERISGIDRALADLMRGV